MKVKDLIIKLLECNLDDTIAVNSEDMQGDELFLKKDSGIVWINDYQENTKPTPEQTALDGVSKVYGYEINLKNNFPDQIHNEEPPEVTTFGGFNENNSHEYELRSKGKLCKHCGVKKPMWIYAKCLSGKHEEDK